MPELHRIDWKLLAEAVSHYERIGYRYVEVPYGVPEDIIRLTLPEEFACSTVEPFGSLVGSAEQSLLHLDLPPGAYVACSPCFRPEPVLNRTLPASLHESGNCSRPVTGSSIR
jgi:hypothetical protein